MKYSVIDQNNEMIVTGLTENQAISEAKKAVKKFPDDQIFVSWFRPGDGQHGYLNPDGDHAITGETWS